MMKKFKWIILCQILGDAACLFGFFFWWGFLGGLLVVVLCFGCFVLL